ncbi:MAG: CGLD27 family protein, partial [Erysipelotrichaceae bacterium]|nr:CGLD27 family protein [Erysipelotrichaceae bacterium]
MWNSLWQGWFYISDRLFNQTVFYEESGWYDAQTWIKPEEVLNKEKVDIVVIATTSWMEDQISDLRKIVIAGINCISIAEEMANAYAQNPELAV